MDSLSYNYRFEGVNGAIVFGPDSSVTDWIGYTTNIDPEVEVSTNSDSLGRAPGGLVEAPDVGILSLTFEGFTHSYSLTTLQAQADAIKAMGRWAVNPGTIKWVDGSGNSKQIDGLRLASKIKPSHGGRLKKEWQLQFSAADPFAYSQQLHSPDPWADNTEVLLANPGTADSWPAYYIQGPFQGFTLENRDTGQQWVYTGIVAAGQYLYVDTHPARRRIRLNGNINAAAGYDWRNSEWWAVAAESGTKVRLLANGATTATTLRAAWRYAWEV